MATRVWGLSKKNANYRPAPQAEVRCDRCKYMLPHLHSAAVGWFGG